MCYVKGCGEGSSLGGLFVEGACATHLAERVDAIKKDFKITDNARAKNYALAYILMSDRAAVLVRLKELNDWMSGWDVKVKGLAKALSYHELLGWFPVVDITPLKAITPAEFLGYIAKGCVLKDPGAGVPHGQFTHRLQWYALASVMTLNWTKPFDSTLWSMSPLELYCAYGDPTDNPGLSANQTLWGDTFDMFGSNPDNAFRGPDNLNAAVLSSVDMPTLKKNVADRRDKRISDFLEGYNQTVGNPGLISPYGLDLSKSPVPVVKLNPANTSPHYDYDQVFGYLDTMHAKGVHAPSGMSKAQVHSMVAVDVGTHKHLDDKLKKQGKPALKGEAVYEEPLHGPPSPEMLAARISSSRSKLNTVLASLFLQSVKKKYA